jgi:hypothetical protein
VPFIHEIISIQMSRYKIVLVVIAATIVAVIGGLYAITSTYYDSANLFDWNNTTTTRMQPPPLYPGVQWQAPQPGKYPFWTGYNKDNEQLKGYHVDSILLKSCPDRLLSYYRQVLGTRGWTLGGPGTRGQNGSGSDGYHKDRYYINVVCYPVSSGSSSPYQAYVEYSTEQYQPVPLW